MTLSPIEQSANANCANELLQYTFLFLVKPNGIQVARKITKGKIQEAVQLAHRYRFKLVAEELDDQFKEDFIRDAKVLGAAVKVSRKVGRIARFFRWLLCGSSATRRNQFEE